MVRALLLAMLVSSATAAADPAGPIDVHVDVNVNVNGGPSDTPVIAKPRWSQEARTWLTVTEGGGPDMTAYRVQLDVLRGVIGHTHNGGPVYGIVGAAATRAFSSSTDFLSEDLIDARDDRFTAYAGIAGRTGRFEARMLMGFGVERTVGTLGKYMVNEDIDRINPVGDIAGEMMLRVVGPVGVVAGGRLTAHIQQYAWETDMSDAFWRIPDVELYAGIAMLTR
jgi:hypothetical protein